MVSEGGASRFDAALRHFGLTAISVPTLVADSVSNENFRVDTAKGPVFLKLHKSNRTPERLRREQAIIAWAGERGLPVAAPLAATDGSTLVELDGRWWSLYPWIDGGTYQRGAIDVDKARELGAIQGMLHRVLAEYPAEGLGPNSELLWDTATSLRDLEAVWPGVESRGTEQERRWVRRQRELLESGAARASSEFDLPRQPTHGDFHERNVMLRADGGVAAIVDWERVCLQPAVFEVLRAVSFMLLLEEPLLSAYLRGYGSEARLAEADVLPAVEAWWQSAMHNTWALRDAFLAGNEAPRQFLPQEEGRSRLFNDSAFREWLAEAIIREAC